MKFMKSSAFALGVLAASAISASAADLYTAPAPMGGMYASIFGGAVFPYSISATQDSANPAERNANISLDTGFSVSGDLGYDFGNGFRVEGQFGYLNMDTDTLTLPNAGPISDDMPGTLDGIYGMANGWYAFEMGAFKPFVGGGIGFASMSIDAGPYFGGISVDDSDTAFAWQVGGGAEFAVSENISLVGRYRYFATSDFSVRDSDGTDISASFDTHIVEAGIRFEF
jgi:opacity protein-like surface antigen